jgi:hypothetical protein
MLSLLTIFLSFLAIFLGAALGAVILGSILYSLFRAAVGVFVKNLKVRYLLSIVLTTLGVVPFSTGGYAISDSVDWTFSLLYVPGLIIIAIVFYRRDVIVSVAGQNESQNA